ncbi:hypothetical protein [Micromonospora aurantiaca (nom. illeg.)]|uniref:hypothetical protein n=1 Tax=Micromonospora aurantiaca (nom. illeg.) TaxID=47850 RepID=UPI000828FD2E|nr:hypothetical protein [Micromonospora aurantiaca]RNI00053.1 hypothetical protein EEZ25_20995 [Micromonospora aurantiaca]SCL40962.1 hypothetical protein GA0070615_4723 [Micromonospora aurantiaca]
MAEPDRPVPHRPGAVSLFFVAKAAVFALGFWIWLLVLAERGGEATGVHLIAATGAICTTLAAVVLGARMALQRNAAVRHAELKRLLVDISWNAFAAAGNAERAGKVVPFRSASHDGERGPTRGERVSVLDRGDRNRGDRGR